MVSVCCSATAPTTLYQHLEPYIHLHIVTILNKIQEDWATSAPYEHEKDHLGVRKWEEQMCVEHLFSAKLYILVIFYNILFLTWILWGKNKYCPHSNARIDKCECKPCLELQHHTFGLEVSKHINLPQLPSIEHAT